MLDYSHLGWFAACWRRELNCNWLNPTKLPGNGDHSRRPFAPHKNMVLYASHKSACIVARCGMHMLYACACLDPRRPGICFEAPSCPCAGVFVVSQKKFLHFKEADRTFLGLCYVALFPPPWAGARGSGGFYASGSGRLEQICYKAYF